jgi:hypothetical protein
MRHPSTLARNRRRKHLFIYRWPNDGPRENRGCNKGGKQYIAHGNRCFHSMMDRHERRTQLKRSRRADSGRTWLKPCQ